MGGSSATSDGGLDGRAERRLAEVEALSHIGSWEWDIAADRVEWSPELYRIYGVEPGTSIGFDDYLERVHPDDRERVRAEIGQAYAERRPFSFEHRLVRPDGSAGWMLSRGEVVVDEAGEPLRMLGTGQDITERVEQEAARQSRVSRDVAGRARDDALAMIAHDLRTPLSVIVGYAQLLRRQAGAGRVEPAAAGQQLGKIEDAARQATAMLEDLLADARSDDEEPLSQLAETDFVALVRRIVEGHAELAQRHELLVDAPEPGIVVECEEVRIERALHNLLLNAMKYSPDGGRVTVGIRDAEPDAVELSVRDEGIGIPADELPHVFERFHRGANAAGLVPGLGLGLTSVARTVRLHGGSVDVTSVEGEGTTFTIRLPRRRAVGAGPA